MTPYPGQGGKLSAQVSGAAVCRRVRCHAHHIATTVDIAGGDQTQALIGTLRLGAEYQSINGFKLGGKVAGEIGSDGFTAARASATLSGSF